MADFQFRTGSAIVGTIVAQGNSDGTGCRIVVGGVFKADTISHEASALTVCVLKAA